LEKKVENKAMFGHKILSIVSLLFLGSLTSVKAETASLPDCPNTVFNPTDCTTSERTHDSYCKSGLKIYSITSGNLCVADVADLTANTVNIIDTTNVPATANTGEGIAALVTGDKIALVDCGASSCSQTFGYFVSTEGTAAYYRIGADGTNAPVELVADCNEAVGKLFTGNELCISDSNHVAFGTNADYLIEDDGAAFTGSAGSKVVVASRTNSITTVNIGDKSYLVTDKAGLLNESAADDLVVKLNVEEIEVDDSINGKDYCVDKHWAVYERIDGLCNAVVDEEDCTYYDCTAGKSCTVSSQNRDPRGQFSEPCIPDADTKCGAGYYLVNGAVLATSTGVLWECFGDTKNCESQAGSEPRGFIINAGKSSYPDNYIECTDANSCIIAAIGDDCVENTTVGKATYGGLFTEDSGTTYQLCLYDGGKKSITIGSANKYLIEKKATSMLGFDQDTDAATKYVVLEVDASKNILPVASTETGYYSVGSIANLVVTAAETGVILYSCAADTVGLKCGQVTSDIPIGYLVNKGNGSGSAPYIECVKGGTCDAIAVSGECSQASHTGSLHSTNKLCVYTEADYSITLTGANEGKYLVSAGTSLFGLKNKADSYIVVNLDNEGNLTVVKESSAVRYRYTLNTDSQNKVHPRAQAVTETGDGDICGTGTPKEFTMIQWVDEGIEADKADYYIASP